MKTRIFFIVVICLQMITGLAFSTTRYVSPSGSNTFPYTTLATAATGIKTAVDVCSAGDLVLVDDGTYILTLTVSITTGITVQSIHGAGVTIVDGNHLFTCFFINNANAVLRGFTIQNGYYPGGFGGGVHIDAGGTVENCLIRNNQARDGGGVALDNGGLVQNCIIHNNLANNGSGSGYGGGVRILNNGEVRNCEIKYNVSAYYGGGVNTWEGGKVKNCVIAFNEAPVGAGIRTRKATTVYNCIIYYNIGTNYDLSGSGYYYYNSCTVPALPVGSSSGCITSNPLFVNDTPGSDDLHLQAGSPCIDAGMNLGWMATVPDLDGNPRIVNAIVDMGPYEYSAPVIVDSDGDGVPDVDDDYPTDPTRAFDNFYPAGGNGTLGFEDLWPGMGDYDFNDLVCDYRFKTVTNASNIIVEMFATFTVKAYGAGLHNGFGFQFPDDLVNQSDLQVTGYDLGPGSYITLNADGLEPGQTRPTFIVYDDAYRIMPAPGIGIGANTTIGAPYVTPVTLNLHIAFTGGSYTIADVNIAHFNPFIIIGLNRTMEVHLPDLPPTSKANQALFGTFDDTSDPLMGRYYKTAGNLPWAINISESFDYPIEKTEITQAYNHFIEWAESSGVLYPDWYRDLPGYRNPGRIYHH